MATDLRTRRAQLPVIPSANVVRQRLRELQDDAHKLNILLRLASELEQTDAPSTEKSSEVHRG